jgi:hypothetical protein
MVMIETVAASDDLQPGTGMFRERVEHVIEKFDVRIDLDRAAVEREPQIDLRLFCGSLDGGAARAQLRAPATWPLRVPIGVLACTSGPT